MAIATVGALAILGAGASNAAANGNIDVDTNNPEANDWRCGIDQWPPCKTISGAVAKAADHEGSVAVYVEPGTYRDNVRIQDGNDVDLIGNCGGDDFRCVVLTAHRGDRPALDLGRDSSVTRMSILNIHRRADAVAVRARGDDLRNAARIDRTFISSPHARDGALIIHNGATLERSLVSGSMNQQAVGVRVKDGNGRGEAVLNANTISAGTAIFVDKWERSQHHRAVGAWNRINGQVKQASGELRLFDSIIQGQRRGPAVLVEPRAGRGAVGGQTTRLTLQSVTVVAHRTQPALAQHAGKSGRWHANMRIENTLAHSPGEGPLVYLRADNHARADFTFTYSLFSGPSVADGSTFEMQRGGREVNRHGIEVDIPGGRTVLHSLRRNYFEEDPGFVSERRGNFHLGPESPAIDAGDPQGRHGGEPGSDLDFNPRFVGAARDVGAYEVPDGEAPGGSGEQPGQGSPPSGGGTTVPAPDPEGSLTPTIGKTPPQVSVPRIPKLPKMGF